MKKTELMNKITGAISKAGFRLRKHSPEILIVAGVVGTVASAVLACKATTKVNDILSETKDQLDKIHGCMENEALVEKYSLEDAKKDTAIIYIQASVKLAKLYAPAITLGVLSLTSILASNDILRKRNVALAAAYATVNKSFKEYRNRVSERFGAEVEHQLKYNIKATQVEETITDENGEEKVVANIVDAVDYNDPNGYSDYARFFDMDNPYWEKDSEYNLMFLRAQQAHANDKLRANGYLFLNEVYEMLGIPKTKAGQVVGWVYDTKNPIGDNYIDFGIYDVNRTATRNFVNGYERTILLDFNVDGNIWELM